MTESYVNEASEENDIWAGFEAKNRSVCFLHRKTCEDNDG